MFVTHLNTRRKEILQSVVEMYIQTAAAVSSQGVSERLRSQLSAATVRNLMAELDELGLVWQPHTSAGRIPTDKGYRCYIDSILEFEQLRPEEKELIEGRCLAQHEVWDRLLTEILRILAGFSGYTALAFSSGIKKIMFKRLELVGLQQRKLLVVLISQTGLVKTDIVQMPYDIERQELAKVARIFNDQFASLTLDEIKQQLSLKLSAAQDVFFHLFEKASQILNLAFTGFDDDKLYLEGASFILEQPEFQDHRKLQALLKVFEQEQPLLEIMREDLNPDGTKVHIGSENHCEEIQECSLVVSNFKINGRNMGSLGIIGPRRMPYARAISTVSYVAGILSERMVDSEL